MICCDGKHKKKTLGAHDIMASGTVQAKGYTVEVKLGALVRGMDFCPECFAEVLGEIDLKALVLSGTVQEG